MTIDIRVPTLPESVTDATILTWHKKPGDRIRRDENLVDLETDKVVLEVPSPTDGILKQINAEDGQSVEADELLGSITPGAASATNDDNTAVVDAVDEAPILTPSVRRLVKELALDPAKITGTGKDGRLLKSDIMQYMDQQKTEEDIDSSIATAPAERMEKSVPMSRLRARIAERLVEAQQTSAILTTFNEVNLQAIKNLRSTYKEAFEQTHGVRLGFMSFFVKAVVEALQKFPLVNASVDGNNVIYHNYYDVGIAVGSSRGLVVPVLRNADQLNFADVETSIRAFGKKAEEGTLSYEELTGGTFSISNGGVYGSMLSTPILNPPQSAILGMHNILERPIAENGEVVIRPMMYLALSYDHRIIDGKEAVQFLVSIKNTLEDPSRLLLHL